MTENKKSILKATNSSSRIGVQSLEIGLSILSKLASSPRSVTLSELAFSCKMTPSKVHRYLASLVKLGFVYQKERSGRYEIGPSAAQLGLAAIASLDFVNRAGDLLDDVVETTNAAALVAIWGDHGPTVVRWLQPENLTITSIGLGTTLPLLNSATGHIFLTYSNPRITKKRLTEEIALPNLEQNTNVEKEIERIRLEVRARGYAVVDSPIVPDYVAVSFPILNWQDEAEAAITITSRNPSLADPNGKAIQKLSEASQFLSLKSL